jgi:pyruvate/2-oxoglutarate dehydrogenase complex dihydrolipoamide acyltransferase (E2) component
MFEFRLPDLGEGVAEGEVVRWFVREGDAIAEDAPLVSVLTDKANVEIPSPRSGRVLKIHAPEGAKVKVGALLVTIDTGEPSTAPAAVAAPVPAPPSPATAQPAPAPIETARSGPPASAAEPSSARVLATPFLRRLAAERGIDLAGVRGSGPGGRILESDLAEATAPVAAAPAPPAPAAPPSGPAEPAEPSVPVPAAAEIERVPIRGLRRVIAEHMAEAVHRAAHFTYVEEIDATELVRVRERIGRHLEGQGVKLTYLPFIIKGVVAGLRAHPTMNATMDDERQELVVHRRYHIGIAMAAPDGLIVPVVRDANTKSVGQLARELQDFAERGKAGKLTRGELSGSTFTITSLGALGGVLATPILNYPEVAILGVHRIVRRPTYRPDGSIGPADLMNLSVSLDHRVLDGIVGAQFLAVVKTYLEDPHVLFVELA